MGILTADMKRVVQEQRLGYVATVCSDGTPNLSPKDTTTIWDDDHLIFADIRSPGTISNLRLHLVLEINVVDPIVRKQRTDPLPGYSENSKLGRYPVAGKQAQEYYSPLSCQLIVGNS